MNKPINIITIDRGIIDGLQTFEVINADTGETIGWNQSSPAIIEDETPVSE